MSENSEMTAQQYTSLAALAAVMVGVLAIFAWALRLGSSSISSLVERGVAIVGEIPQGLPAFVIPEATGEDVLTLLPLALAFLVLSYVELSSLARTYARKRKYHVDTDQELLALGASSISTGFFYYLPETILAALIASLPRKR